MNPNASDNKASEAPLESWKEIAAYLQRNAVTVRRWEKEEGLPVHRHSHKSRASVYAYPSEIDAWRAGRKVVPEPVVRLLWKIPAFAATMALCLVMVGNGIRPQVASAQNAGAVNRQLWTGPKVDPSGNVSSDGRLLSFTDWKTGDLSLHDLTTGQDRRLTNKGTLQGGEPRELLRVAEPETLGGFVAWSPDGKSLLFRKFVAGATRRDIWRISAEGGTPHEVGLNEGIGRSPSIHPDGHQVAYTTIGQSKHEIWALENFLPQATKQ